MSAKHVVIPAEAAARLAGCSVSLILALLERGLLEAADLPGGLSVGVGQSSLIAYLNGRCEALRWPPRGRELETRKGEQCA